MKKSKRQPKQEVIFLKDLTPRKEISGGSDKFLFGQTTHPASEESSSAEPKKDQKKK